jgi:hypothetical protein
MKPIGSSASMVALALTVLCNVAVAKDAKLVFAPEGKTLHYTIDAQQEMSVGFEYETNHKGDVKMTWMETTADGNTKLSVKFSNLQGTAKMGDELQDAPLGINGVDVWVVVSPQGEVLETDPQASVAQQEQMLLEEVIQTLIPYYSEDKVGEGDSWIQDKSVEPKDDDDTQTVEGEFEYFLEKFSKNNGLEVAKIVSEGKLKITQQTPSGPVTGEAKGGQEFEVALNGGYPTKTKSTVEFHGKMGGRDIAVVFRIECALKKDVP